MSKAAKEPQLPAGTMLYEISRIIQGGAAVCRHASSTAAARVQHEHLFPDAHQPRDYALPNPTWNPETKRLYEELSRDPSWRRLPSYEEFAGSRSSMRPEADGKTRLFTRNLDQEGIGFEYCMFYNEAEKRTVCIFQPGPYLGGLTGPIPLGSTVLIDSRVEKVDGQKVYTRCQVRSHDSAVLHSEATALYIMLKSGESESRL
ncbi:acyl-coenzyme A thioesterase THEM4-like isoform X5 [Lithobates pipiens]